MKSLALAAMLCLSSCGSEAPVDDSFSFNMGKDGYRFEQANFQRTNLQVKIVLYPNVRELRHALQAERDRLGQPRMPLDQVNKLMAFSVINIIDQGPVYQCTIHMVSPRDKYYPEYLGHELYHCMYGSFHE